jgi:ATP-dependent RNA helicase DDX27
LSGVVCCRSVSLVGENDRKILKLAIKNSRDKVRQRMIKTEMITQYKGSIEEMKGSVEEIIKEEKEEKNVNIMTSFLLCNQTLFRL